MKQFDPSKDYYAVLGAAEDALPGEIERLYRRLAVQHHPDRGGDEERMKALNEAYAILSDNETRRIYDEGKAGTVEEEPIPHTSESLHVDAAAGQSLSAVLLIGAGLALALLVRFQWMWFLWPLAILALCLVAVGVVMAHLAIRRMEGKRAISRGLTGVALEVIFWAGVVGGGYGIYLVLR